MKTDPVLLEILANRFRGVVEEMAYTIYRTAFSAFVKETWDFIAGLTTRDGEIFAFPEKAAPMLLGSHTGEAIARVSDYSPGDIILTNDPHSTGGLMTQVNDLNLLKPFFWKGELLFFLWDFLHLSDVGGAVPGSISLSNYDIFQEGIRIPPMKLYREGRLNQELADIYLTNTRTPQLNWGDLQALVAALNCGETRLHQTLDKYGPEVVKQGVEDLLSYGEAKARGIIERIPDGVYRFHDYLETHQTGDRPIRISLALTVDGSNIHLDFSGTDPQVPLAFNLLSGGKRHTDVIYGMINFLRTADPAIPLNAGILRPIDVVIPRGSLLNPEGHPAIGARMATVVRCMDTLYGALSQAAPDLIPAASGDATLIFLAVPEEGQGGAKVSVLQPLAGGYGARATKDGVDAVDVTIAWLRNVPTEMLEADLPILITRYHLDSKVAAGKFRGGRGTVFEFQMLKPGCRVVARMRSRLRFRPWGKNGGEPGGRVRVWLNPGTEGEREFGMVDVLELRQGDVLRFVSSCGGAFGDPRKREPRMVLKDVEDELLSAQMAETDYGVIIRDGSVDVQAAAASQDESAHHRLPRSAFVYGLERAMFDMGWSDEVPELGAFLADLPAWMRGHAAQLLVSELSVRFRPDKGLDAPAIGELLDTVRRRLSALVQPRELV